MGLDYNDFKQTQHELSMLRADFSDLANIEKQITDIFARLSKANAGLGRLSANEADATFAEIVRVEMGKQLTKVRDKAIQKASAAGAGSAASAVHRRMYKDRLGGNVNILGSRKRISNRKRQYTPGHQRDVSNRTRNLNEYYGPDRAFILRFLEYGTDVRTAEGGGIKGRGSRSSWGRRGAIGARSFFHTLGADMEQAAKELGLSVIDHCEKLIEKAYKDL